MDPIAEGRAAMRAFLRIGGLSIARQQVALAFQMDCERIVCIAAGPSPELAEIQQLVEAKGAQFHLIRQARALVGLVSAVDEVLVFADGLFATTSAAVALLEEGQSVSVQPIEQGLAAGFERIDLNHAFGGMMRLPGRLVERLAEQNARTAIILQVEDPQGAEAADEIAALAGPPVKPVRSGVRLSLDPDNAGKVYYGFASGVTTGTGYLLPAGGETTVNPAEIDGDLANLYLIADTASQVVTGVVL